MTTVLERKPKSAQKHTYKIYDCDHHYYETPDAFLRHLPKEYKKYFQYVEVNGRTKLAVNGRISDYIPNPTFEVVAAPGTHEKFFRAENPEGLSLREMTELAKFDVCGGRLQMGVAERHRSLGYRLKATPFHWTKQPGG